MNYPMTNDDFDAVDETVRDFLAHVALVEAVHGRELKPARLTRAGSKGNVTALSTPRLARHIAALSARYEALVDASDAARADYVAWAEPIIARSRPLTELEDAEGNVHLMLVAQADKRLMRTGAALYRTALVYLKRYVYKPLSREQMFKEYPAGDDIRLRRAVAGLLAIVDALDVSAGASPGTPATGSTRGLPLPAVERVVTPGGAEFR